MNNSSSFLRQCHSKAVNQNSTNNENDENSSRKNFIFKHLAKNHSSSSIINNNIKGTIRGVLGDVGNHAASGKSSISIDTKAKIIEETKFSSVNSSSTIPNLVNKIEKFFLNDEKSSKQSNYPSPSVKLVQVPLEFDCDSEDKLNITAASEFIADICQHWRDLEKQTPIRQNFLVNRAEGTVSPQNRAVLIDWLFQVHDRFKLLSDTFHMTIQLIDQYLQMTDVSKQELQLIGSTALLIACKYEEMTIPGMNDFVYVSDNAFTKDDMKEMERLIMIKLSFNLGRPLSINYLRRYSKIVHATDIEHTLGKYLLDLTLIDHSFSHFYPSYISACASFLSRYLLAFKHLNSSTSISLLIEHLWPNELLNYHTGYSLSELRSGIEQLAQLLIGQETNKFRSVQKKYSQTNLFSISENCCCKSSNVQLAMIRLFK